MRLAARGDLQVSFGVTEPDARTDTTSITTFAEKAPGGYRVSGRKVFISRAEQAERLLLIVLSRRPRQPPLPTPTGLWDLIHTYDYPAYGMAWNNSGLMPPTGRRQ